MGDERKFASVLFADIVGSTAFGEAHDPEIVREALSSTFASWRQILVAHGGTVEKFIGDSVMAVFGVPAAHEDDPERAIRAAFALRERMRRDEDSAFDIRIGIASGEVVSGGAEDGGQFLVTGPSVNLAARLQSAASPGEILVDPRTRKLAQHVVAFDDARPVEAKGIGRVEAAPARDLTSALPSARSALGDLRSALIGRQRELRLLDMSYERVREEGKPSLLTIFGVAGIGKSRLLEEWTSQRGHPALIGRCLPYGEGITFWPIREMIFADAGVAATDVRDEVTAKIRAAVLRVFGAADADADAVARRLTVLVGAAPADEAIPDVGPGNVAAELRWAVRRYLERRAAGAPLALVFEDLHWAEPALLDLVEHLVEWSGAPLFVVCLARSELLDVRPGWGGGRTNATAVTLEPLTYDETLQLIGGLLSIPHPPSDLVDDICPRADGNPLYVEEFLRTMIETARVTRVEGQWLITRGLPEMSAPPTLHGLMAARLDRVPAGVKRSLQQASVIGKRFACDALEAIAGAPIGDDVVGESIRRGLVRELDEQSARERRAYEFHHNLAREVAYAAVPKGERMRMHDRYSRWLEQAAGDRIGEYGETVAHHAEQAFRLARDLRSPRATELGTRAFRLLVAAATRARRRADLTAATRLYGRAADIGETVGLPMSERVEAEGFSALTGYYVEGTSEAVARLDRVIEAAREAGPSEVLVRLLSQRGFIGRVDESSDHYFEEGIAVARATGDPTLIAHAMTLSNAQSWARGDLVTHEVVLREAYEFMKRTGAKADLGICLVWLATNALQRGDFTAAAGYLDEATAEAEASGSKFQLWAVRRLAARAAIARAEHALAVRLANDAVALGHEVGAKRLVGLAYVRLGDALYEAGEAAQARTILEQALQTIDRETMREAFVEVRWKLARASLAAGDREAALGHALAAREAANDPYSCATAAATLAAVRSAEGDRSGAEQLYAEALATVAPTGFQQLRADIQRELARHHIRHGRPSAAEPLIAAIVDFYRDPLATRRREEALALRRAAEATLPA